MAATILFCYSSFTFWQYLHFSTGGSHAAKHGSVEEKRMEFVELILSKGNTIKMIPSLPLCWVKLLRIGSSVPNLTWCSCFPASPTTFSPLTEGQSNFSWWALSVCIVFVSSSAMGVQACAWFSLVFVRLLPDCAQLNNAFYLWQSLSFILSRATFSEKLKKHIYNKTIYYYCQKSLFSQSMLCSVSLWLSEIFKAAIKSTLKCIGHKYFGVSLQILATWNWRSVLSILFKSKQSFMDICWLICCDLRVLDPRLVTCDWRDICNEHANMFLVLILSKLSMAAGPTSVKFLTKWRVISRPMISEYSRRDARSRLEIDTRRVSIHPDCPD